MKGIQFLVDDTGEKKAVLLDLKKYGDLWEDVYDTILARERQGEERESLEAVNKRLRRKS
jgi:oligoribonuclease NrnB/cAMP/cGMP phosphodiesterase (DHH superfamily)